jgi:integrase
LSQPNNFPRRAPVLPSARLERPAFSKVLALTSASIDIESGVASIITLKRRKRGIVRQVPLPAAILIELDDEFDLRSAQRDPDRANERIWKWSRTTAWRRIKEIMAAARISCTPAMTKGLLYGFGVNAFQSNVPPHLVQRRLGSCLAAYYIYLRRRSDAVVLKTFGEVPDRLDQL